MILSKKLINIIGIYRDRLMKRIIYVGSLLALLLSVWEIVGTKNSFVKILVSHPSKIFNYSVDNYYQLTLDMIHTAGVAFFGLLLAFVLGLLLTFIALQYPKFSSVIRLASSVSQTVPIIVFVPFLVITIGSNFLSKVVLACLMSLFVLAINMITNLEKARANYNELISLYNLSKAQQYFKVLIPVSVAPITGAIRSAAGLAVLGAVVVEFTGSRYGLGKNIFLSSVRLEPDLLMVSVLLCLTLGLGVHLFFNWVEKRYFWWS